jgi:hypothetical protein
MIDNPRSPLMHAVIDLNGNILWQDDPDLLSSAPAGAPGHYNLTFRRPVDRDVFVLHAKTAGPGCDAPRAVATSIQGGPRRICVTVSVPGFPDGGVAAQFSYIRIPEASVPSEPSGEGEQLPCTSAETQGWYAWLDQMPPGPQKLFVIGEVLVGNPGVEVRLVRKAPQGFNPVILLLDLEMRQLPGMWPMVMTWKPVRYEEEAMVDFQEVGVFCGDAMIAQIPVDIVS